MAPRPAPATTGQDDDAVIQHLYGIDIRTPWPIAGVPARTDGTARKRVE